MNEPPKLVEWIVNEADEEVSDEGIHALLKISDAVWTGLRRVLPPSHACAVVVDIVMDCAVDMAREHPAMREDFTKEILAAIAAAFEDDGENEEGE